MRLFVAVRFSPEIRSALLETIASLSRSGSGNFTRPENLHLTLAFLGETEDPAGAKAALAEAATGGPFPLTVGGFGSFDDLLWVGIGENLRLKALALNVQDALRRWGFPIERRSWQPHITVARQYRGPRSGIEVPARTMTVNRVSLMQSERISGQLTYTEIFGATL